MEKVYFLAGLGTEQDDVAPLVAALEKRGFELVYVDLPGQHSQRDSSVSSADQFRIWIQSEMPQHAKILAFSLGADLLLSFLEDLSPSHVVLLDGGILTLEDTGSSLESELEDAATFITEQNLNMEVATVQALLRMREDYRCEIWDERTEAQILMLICDSYPELLAIKKRRLSRNKNPNLQSQIIENSTHQLFVDQPERVAECVDKFFHKK